MKKILTLVLDGFGIRDDVHGNAILNAKMPNYQKLLDIYPHSKLIASGPAVGLTEGEAGNQIVGYTTLGAGEKIKQRSSFVHDFADIDSLATNPELKSAVEQARKYKSTIHIIGLMSDGGKSSNINDIVKIIEYLKTQEINLGVDFISDGRDVESKSVGKYIEQIENTGVPIISVCGRYYAMDSSEKWDRTRIYYDLVRNGVGLKVKEIGLALKNCYIRNITDEFLPPMILEPDRNLKNNDVVLWVNYNEEGATQTLLALTNPDEITEFQTRKLNNGKFLMLYSMGENVNATVLVDKEEETSNSLGTYLSKLDLTQARIANRDAFEYVTNYFNGVSEKKLSKCNNYLMETSDIIVGKEAEINCGLVTKQIIKCMEKDTDFILASISSLESITKNGNFNNTVKVLEFIDECIGKIIESAELNFYTVFITSTFGSVEDMISEEGKPITVHTTNPVPFIITDTKVNLSDGTLTDVAPTILSYMDISIPESMKESKVLIND